MLDIRLIRREPDAVRAALARRGPDAAAAVDRVLELDERWREITHRARGAAGRAEPGQPRPPRAADAGGARAARRAGRARPRAERRGDRGRGPSATPQLAALPNLPAPDAPDEDTVLREVGRGRRDRARPPGAGRPADRHGARRAPVGLALRLPARRPRDARARARPLRAREAPRARASSRWSRRCSCASARSTGPAFLPDTEQQIYRLPDDDLYLVGTSEVALASLHDDEILAAGDLPLRYAGFSTCFRREAGAAGKDTRGIFRVHQFDKVEMFAFVEPDQGRRRARAAARDRGVDPQRAGDPLPGGGHRRRRPRRLGGQEVRLRGVAARAGPLPRADLVLEHDRLPGAAAGDPLPAGARAGRRTSTR